MMMYIGLQSYNTPYHNIATRIQTIVFDDVVVMYAPLVGILPLVLALDCATIVFVSVAAPEDGTDKLGMGVTAGGRVAVEMNTSQATTVALGTVDVAAVVAEP